VKRTVRESPPIDENERKDRVEQPNESDIVSELEVDDGSARRTMFAVWILVEVVEVGGEFRMRLGC
jgi:hypothetical protein